MAKHSSSSSSRWLALQKQRWLFPLLVGLSVTTALAFILRTSFDSPCDHCPRFPAVPDNKRFSSPLPTQTPPNSLTFMKSKRVLLDLREIVLISSNKPSETDEIIYSLEHKMLHRGVQVLSAKGQEAMDTALKADLVVLNTAVAGKWLDAVLKENVTHVLPKVLRWIHEMRGHYFKMEFAKHLPLVAGAMIDSHGSRIRMPETYVVHFGNSKELMEVAEDKVAKRVLREHIRESLGKLKVPSLHAVIVGSDMTAQTKFESELLNFVAMKKIQNRVHFVNKTVKFNV
ncbi:hypothetical protein HYC85_002191 [Camellia sinensis]|uniref:Uncharacterized protein n=1 Tax=Camellia sinensis TaxID=4442 RepID=A0A7J7I7H9_CAMSI|nr:hypothetical protein HYC85_002191 [Camellia sinensis]